MQYMYVVWNKFAHLRSDLKEKNPKNIFGVGDIEGFFLLVWGLLLEVLSLLATI